MKNLSLHQFFIIGILFSCVFSGCKTGELENRLDNMERQATAVEVDFRAGNYAVADRVFERFGHNIPTELSDNSKIFIQNGYMTKTENGLALTRNGFLMSNTILSEIL